MGTTEIVQALVSPAEKLIEAVSGAIGKAYEPKHIRKIAKRASSRLAYQEITKQQKLEWLKLAEEYINENDDYFEWFLCNQFDENYYGEGKLTLGRQKVAIESIWTDKDNHINIHVDCPYYEGDILMKSISKKNQLDIIAMLRKRVEEEYK